LRRCTVAHFVTPHFLLPVSITIMPPAIKLCLLECVRSLFIPQPTEWQRIGDEIHALIAAIHPARPFMQIRCLRALANITEIGGFVLTSVLT
jgi:hypothetical protein